MKKIIFLFIVSFTALSLKAQKVLTAGVWTYWFNQMPFEKDSSSYIHTTHRSFYDQAKGDFVLNPDTMYHFISADGRRFIYHYDQDGYPFEILVGEPDGSGYKLSVREKITYNSAHRILTSTHERWDEDDQDWYISSKTENDYDSKMNLLSRTELLSDNMGILTNFVQSRWTYSSTDLVLSKAIRKWVNNDWVDLSQESYKYDAYFKLRLYILKEYNFLSYKLEHIDSVLYQYNPEGNRSQAIKYQYDFINEYYEPAERQLFSYNSDNLLTIDETYDWYTGSWRLIRTLNYSYHSDKKLKELIHYTGQFSEPKFKYAYEYNSQGNPRLEYLYTWNSMNWANTSLTEHSYDSDGDLLHYAEKLWNGTAWVQSGHEASSRQYYYSYLNSVPGIKSEVILSIYPNPALDRINIRWDKEIRANRLIISDVKGQDLLRSEISELSSRNLDVSGLPPGVYFLYLFDSDGLRSSRKFVKL